MSVHEDHKRIDWSRAWQFIAFENSAIELTRSHADDFLSQDSPGPHVGIAADRCIGERHGDIDGGFLARLTCDGSCVVGQMAAFVFGTRREAVLQHRRIRRRNAEI